MDTLSASIDYVRRALMAHFEGTKPLTRCEAAHLAGCLENAVERLEETTVNRPPAQVVRLVQKERE